LTQREQRRRRCAVAHYIGNDEQQTVVADGNDVVEITADAARAFAMPDGYPRADDGVDRWQQRTLNAPGLFIFALEESGLEL
jgi:hypothetical protein